MRVSASSLLAASLSLLASLWIAEAPAATDKLAPSQDGSDAAGAPGRRPERLRPTPSHRGPAEPPVPVDRDLRLIPADRRPVVPSFPSDLEGVRSSPLTLALLKGRIVLLEAWEPSSINCRR